MRRSAIAVLVLSSAILASCSTLKLASSSGDDDAEDGGTPAPARDGGSGTSDPDGGDPTGDASADASTARPCTEVECPPETIADGLHGPVGVAVNATHVFWIEVASGLAPGRNGELVRLRKGDACSDRSCFDVIDPYVVTGELEGRYIHPTHLALGPHDICHAQSYNASPSHAIRCFSLEALDDRSLANDSGQVVALWVGATDARWVIAARGGAKGEIRGRPLDGGAVTTIVPDLSDPTWVTSDGTDVFWTERGASDAPTGRVAALRQDGGVAVLAANRLVPYAAQVYGPHLYWLEHGARLVMRVRTDGTGAPEQIATTDPGPFALVVDASGVYWASVGASETGTEGSVAHAPHSPGGPTTKMMSNVRNIYGLAADDTFIYVAAVGTKLDEGKILRMRKVR